MPRSQFIILILFTLLCCTSLPLSACTLWGATGSATRGGVTLVAKNRDWKPDNRTFITCVCTDEGYRYVGLSSAGARRSGLKGGINEKGLVIVSASASTLLEEERSGAGKGLIRAALCSCARVDEVLDDDELLEGLAPGFFLLGDRGKIAVIEVAPGGEWETKTSDDGVLCHTNHYVLPGLQSCNDVPYQGSHVRLDRIGWLLKSLQGQLTLEDFITCAADRHDGPDESIWRTGSAPGKARTLASFITAVPRNGPPQLYMKSANPGAEETVERLTLDEAFWIRASSPHCRSRGVPASTFSPSSGDRSAEELTGLKLFTALRQR